MITMKRELITPERAAKLLANNPNNRRVLKSRVADMAADMKAGRWRETHQGLALNCDGSLKDGQHRLAAVVASGCKQWFWVARGVDGHAMEVIDTHKSRSIADAMRISGHEVDKNDVACARAMMVNVRHDSNFIAKGVRPTRLDVMAFLETHIEAIRFVTERRGKMAKFSHANVSAPVARAWYTQDHDRLTEFLTSLRSGVVSRDEDLAVVTLSRYLSTRTGILSGGGSARVALYRKTCSALVAFLERRPITKLYEIAEEPFRIPDDFLPKESGLPGLN